MEENEVIELTDREIQDLFQRQNKINQLNIALSMLRRQYLDAEAELLEKINQSESDYSHLIKFIFQSKTSEKMEDWKFDSSTFTFKKR